MPVLPDSDKPAPHKIPIGISACLLGHRVRYDGQHKLDHYLATTLAPSVRWVPICPEAECGLGTPRPKMRLEGDPDEPRLIVTDPDADHAGADHTTRMQRWARDRLASLRTEGLRGFILKARSPSCGHGSARIFSLGPGKRPAKGMGLFARAIVNAFPLLPAVDDAHLHAPTAREGFFARAFAYDRWLRFLRSRPTSTKLASFHATHSLQVMAHSIRHHQELETLVTAYSQYSRPELFETYISTLMQALSQKATPGKHLKVLRHIAGTITRNISHEDRQELLSLTEDYRMGLTPLIVPVTIIKHHAEILGLEHLTQQTYLNPAPMELMLRNHS